MALSPVVTVPEPCTETVKEYCVTVTVKDTPLLARPPTVTTTLPLVAPAGTGTTMLVADQVVGVVVMPLKVTVLVPCVAPKLAPAIVTDVATGPLAGASVVMVGGVGGTGTAKA